MKRMLSLDISSSTIGWSLFEYNESTASLLEHGHIKPPPKKKGHLPFRLDQTYNLIEELLLEFYPDEVAVEDYAKKFTQGKSRANTIIILSVFNELTSLVSYRYTGNDTHRYPVSTIRSIVGKLFNTKVVSKDDIFPVIVNNCKKFKSKKNRNGGILKQSGDEADAVAVGLTYLVKEHNIQIWDI